MMTSSYRNIIPAYIWQHTSDSVLIGVRTIEPGGRFKRASERQYRGRRIFVDYGLEYSAFEGGYFDASGAPHFYHTDYRGNIVMVTDSAGEVVQRTSYYPYGEPHRLPQGQPYLFASKERHPRTGATLFGPRNLLTSAIFWSAPDTHSGKYTGLSPWSYCGGNPIRYCDPTGCDTLVFDPYGHLMETITNKKMDVIAVRTGSDVVSSNAMPNGTIRLKSDWIESDNYSIFEILGDRYARESFQFLADNTVVEFSHFSGLINNKEVSYLSTSFAEDFDIGSAQIAQSHLDFDRLLYFIHNHPSGMMGISPADWRMMLYLIQHSNNNEIKFFIYISPYINYNNAPTGRYWPYNVKTKFGIDFGQP